MTILEFKKIFTENLSSFYTFSESAEIYSIFIEKEVGYNKFEQRQSGNEKLSEIQIENLNKIISELKTGKPFQQILGETEFYGLKFFVDEHVLIPRPETEELLELAIEEIKKSGFKNNLKILDIGTGSGIIPIVMKKHFPQAEISAIDFSENALKTAKRNADFHEVEINFIHQDYLNEELTETYDVIISNPPYIGIDEEGQIEDSVKEFEPKMALFSPNSNALVFYEKIAQDCKKYLGENGLVFLEINQKLGNETKELFVDVLCEVELMKDLSGNERFVWGRK
ncbi:peptide chain release factor N(5)-glutamine methyltransferase [Kaistella jeonii]|uniref:peptide chain release factor N(5)-glutamine methyltransferase n=1 Tax=Kaistella jeonii TaxID=266749 RepID=A0A0C1DA02_9FLAO|nr:peptide chain release factor N(5)-glutamine methyltransferase [Kaistella jeonii]KIA90750.1 protein-(glutamine-N5) methyltransferase [Kaistella jeonii]SFB68369.1 release factor glutamine methyltransferase [Kaistella jeonii]VEI94631.1 Release factor glutamine methyltransferase [Kaistella jeonii]